MTRHTMQEVDLEMWKLTLALAIALAAAHPAAAESPAPSGKADSRGFSVQTGVGFFANDDSDGFAWNGGAGPLMTSWR